VFNITSKEFVSNASKILSILKEPVSNKINIVLLIVNMEDATNVNKITLLVKMVSAFQKNLDVFIKKDNVLIVNFLSRCTLLPKNVELTDVWKLLLKVVKIANSLSKLVKNLDNVVFQIASGKKMELVYNVLQDIILDKVFIVKKTNQAV